MTDAALDLVALGADVDWTDASAGAEARPVAAAVGGRVGELIEWQAATQGHAPPEPPKRARGIVLGPVTSALRTIADDLGVPVRELELPVDAGPQDAFELGVVAADAEVDSGTDVLVVADPDDSIAVALVVALLTGAEPVSLLPRGADAVDTQTWIEHAEYLRDTRRRLADLRSDPSALLSALGHPRLTATVALIMRAVARRTAVLLDGTAAVTAALVCHDVQARAGRWWRVADTSPDPVHTRAVTELGQRPLLDLALRQGDGIAGALSIALLRAAAALTHPGGAA